MLRSIDPTDPDLDSDGALRHIQAQSRYCFEAEEFARLTGRQEGGTAVKRALQRLSERGRIVLATKRPTCWLIVPPEHEHYGAPPVEWWLDDCVSRIDPDYYVGLLSAARHWGSAHYALQTTQVMLSRPRVPLSAVRLRVDFFQKQGLARTPVVVVRAGVAPWRVSTREATLLDLIRHQGDIGGIEAVARVAKDFAGSIDLEGMAQALDALDQAAAAQRLGFIFSRLGINKAARRVARWLDGRRRVAQPLALQTADPVKQTELDRYWGIRYSSRQIADLESI